LIGFEKAEKTVGTAEGPLIAVDILVLVDFHKDIARKYGGGGLTDHPLPPDIYPPFWKINRKGNLRMQGPQQFYIFFFRPCFYLQRVIIHLFRILKTPPIVNVGAYMGRAQACIFFRSFFAHFLLRKKPGYPGLRYRSGPAYGVAKPLLSLAPKRDSSLHEAWVPSAQLTAGAPLYG
jgi:hypothetical protein